MASRSRRKSLKRVAPGKKRHRTRKSGRAIAEPYYEVVWPLGRAVSKSVALAPAVSDLNGKTVGELWDWAFKGDAIFPILRAELRKRFPRVKLVEYGTLGNTHGPDETQYVAALPGLLKRHGCDVVISAVGA